ncbi:DHHA1 domain-containing protein [Halarcobacter anaerophilus]|uniref:DHHA1 domain-containing protein n=1 Tax=Halarcobacter anaerophilus TaxID=877500 RepID=A0A4Q0Y0N0_9BACT|nr:DHHA1 domain-containing protein [Halarcobacter anaerophilus]QDF28951.1 phosphodiesterase, DHH superfamily [Halarcobacter anaerophilus]RXJ63586.1 hypothetical protein CRV06_05180 [Halarcobacter anaerophilus]
MEIIVYHKNCMDGLASAFIAKDALLKKAIAHEEDILTVPLQYGDEDKFFEDLAALIEQREKKLNVYFVDFSFKRDNMTKLLNISSIEKVTVIDHHKTAFSELCDLNYDFKNFEFIYDESKSGAGLCYDYFESNLNKKMFAYIEDRDLWNWKLLNSKEINAYLQTFIEPNDIDSFNTEYENFDYNYSLDIGKALIKKQEQQVKSKTKKVNTIKIQHVEFNYVNATENISEIGNEICNKYQTPALVFFVNDKKEYVCSLRSLDNLADVSEVAKSFGGGGHRNAAGFTLSKEEFYTLFYSGYKNIPRKT